jgi:F-type H+-transporting ATPase subunit delta
MRGMSRTSLAEVEARLAPLTESSQAASELGNELFAVAGLLASESALRRALSDPSRPAKARADLAAALFGGKISDAASGLFAAVAKARWSAPGDLTAAVEQLAVQAIVAAAEHEGRLDNLEDELFRFGRTVASQPDLRVALTNPFVAADAKRELLAELLAAKVTPETLRLVTEAAANPLGRSLDVSLEEYARLAARRRERLVAEVHVAVPLTEQQRSRLAASLAVAYGHQVHLNVVLDPRVAGGMTVRVGDELIDGSVATRLAEAGRRLVAR